MKLTDYFERIYVINLTYKPERRQRLENHLLTANLASPDKICWVKAISGEICPPPTYFKAGGGAWGCLQSHLRVAQDAAMDGLSNFLVLEDDVVFHDYAKDFLSLFMAQLPSDWDQIYLGGQHLQTPELVEDKPYIFKGININRTHAFAVNSKAFVTYQQHISEATDYIQNGPWHIDHQLGLAHERRLWNTYAPTWWLAGQEQGSSNISGRITPRYWWHHQGFDRKLPFTFFSDPTIFGSDLFLAENFHFGFNLKPNSIEDIGLDDCVDNPQRLVDWLKMIASESMDLWKLPAIFHPLITVEQVANAWDGEVVLSDPSRAKELIRYPWNGLFPNRIDRNIQIDFTPN